MAQEALEEKRGYFRVRARIGLRATRVDRERRESESRRILEDRSEPVTAIDGDLARWLDRIEQKLDRVIEQLIEQPDVGGQEPRDVTLSGGGIRFEADHPFSMGDDVLLELDLPGTPRIRVRCLGRVIHLYDGDEGRSLAIRFDVIRETDRDRIVEHTLEVQRAQLRARAGGASA